MAGWRFQIVILEYALYFPFYNLMNAPTMCHIFPFLFRQYTIHHTTFCCIFHPVERLNMIINTHRRRNSSPYCFQLRDQVALYQNLWMFVTHKWDPHVDSAWPNIRHKRISRHHPIFNSDNAYASPGFVFGLNATIQHIASIIQPVFCPMIHFKWAATNWFWIWLWTYS